METQIITATIAKSNMTGKWYARITVTNPVNLVTSEFQLLETYDNERHWVYRLNTAGIAFIIEY
jgi:hypothetical protein